MKCVNVFIHKIQNNLCFNEKIINQIWYDFERQVDRYEFPRDLIMDIICKLILLRI